MSPNHPPIHPSSGCYVLKLHRDAAPAEGRLCGRVEHVVSGAGADFASAAALLAWLLAHAAQTLVPGAAPRDDGVPS